MKFTSGYQFIYYLLKNNIVFSFDSGSFDHAQLSSINLNIINKEITVDDNQLISDIEDEIYETMCSYFEITPIWIHDFKIYPLLLKSGELVFNTTFYADSETLWDTCSPLYKNCILNIDEHIANIITKELELTSPVDSMIYFATLSIELKVVDSEIIKLDANLNYKEDYISDELHTKELLDKNIKNINQEIKSLVVSSIEEIKKEASNFNPINIDLIVTNADLDQGVVGYELYEERYFSQIELETFKESITEIILEPYIETIYSWEERLIGSYPDTGKGRYSYMNKENIEWRKAQSILLEYIENYILKHEKLPKGIVELDKPIGTVNFDNLRDDKI